MNYLIIGQQQVQGVDYAYTLQGWLKGVNSTAVGDGGWDKGQDGKTSGANNIIARDAYGFSMNYYNNDYDPIGVTNPFAEITIANNLFNGNIKAMTVNIPKLGEALIYGCKYDQLNRLTAMDAYKGLNNVTNVFTPLAINDYKVRVSYDPNGNIKTNLRNGTVQDGSPLAMDNLNYRYIPATNQLDHVNDNLAAINYSIDIDDQDTLNYTYDQIGNLTTDISEGITSIEWTVYGKIKSITKTGTSISYTYDASGNRISKNVNGKETWYARDASGNVMSVYNKDASINTGDVTQSEVHLYGSSRLGIYNFGIDVEHPVPNPSGIITFSRGKKFFELSNDLGNVLATISDKKLAVDANGDGYSDYYDADVISANDYYPFGMGMPGRNYAATNTDYRYGFNGKELDKETSATTTYDYGFRIYSPGLGRFLSVDPLFKNYPWNSSYAFAENEPIANIDLDGLEKFRVTIRTFLPYTYVWEPHSKEIIDKANTRWYPQYRNVDAHGGFKSQQTFDIDFDTKTITKYNTVIPSTISKNLSSKKLQKFENASTKTDQLTTLYENVAHVYTELSTSNPAPWYLTPAINYNLNITVDDNGIWQIKGTWGGFPAMEAFMEDLETGDVDLIYLQLPKDAGKDLRNGSNPSEIMKLIPFYGDRKIDKIGQLGDHPQVDKDIPSPKVKENNKRFSSSDCNCDPPVRNHIGN